MFVGTLTQSTKSAKHSQFSLRAYKLFYQAIYVTLISSQELPLTVMIANRLGNFAHRWVEVLPSFTYLYWSWWTDLNSRPAVYKTAALPIELHQHIEDTYFYNQFPQQSWKVYFAFYLFRQVINRKLHIKNHRYCSAYVFASSSLTFKSVPMTSGSRGRTRTCDPLVNSQLLYLLSYAGIFNKTV